ncbi:Fc.00g095400.m01.CDS01 [Cosmosporella sp. VM-42]
MLIDPCLPIEGWKQFTDDMQWQDITQIPEESFNMFLLSGQKRVIMIEIPTNFIDYLRQERKALGCYFRDICDERTPRCLHCIRHQEHCVWRHCKHADTPDVPALVEKPSPQKSSLRTLPVADSSMINLLHMKLFHHFETHTRHTLTFDTVWVEAIVLSLGCESLMHAIMCLSAKHLAFLQPEDPQNEMAAATHLSQALRLFQRDLAKTVTRSNVDCFLSTAALLSYIVWNEIDVLSTGADSSVTVNALEDRLFSIGGGTLEIFLSANFWICWNQSILFRMSIIARGWHSVIRSD